jgi:hypothetical protein
MREFGKWLRGIALGGAMMLVAAGAAAQGLPSLLIIYCGSTPPTTQMMASGKFSSADSFNACAATPTLATLLGYDAILAFSDSVPADPSGLGDVLADAVDGGRFVTIATYGMSLPWAITGRMQTAAYNPLVIAANADVSGSLVAAVPTDPIFAGVSLAAITYFHNSNFAHATLAPGATLLATDGAGVNMIARSASGRVMGVNLYPDASFSENNAEFYKLIANIASNNAVALPPQEIPTLSQWALIAMGLFVAGIAGVSLRRRPR